VDATAAGFVHVPLTVKSWTSMPTPAATVAQLLISVVAASLRSALLVVVPVAALPTCVARVVPGVPVIGVP
jgi:hypothetical protein